MSVARRRFGSVPRFVARDFDSAVVTASFVPSEGIPPCSLSVGAFGRYPHLLLPLLLLGPLRGLLPVFKAAPPADLDIFPDVAHTLPGCLSLLLCSLPSRLIASLSLVTSSRWVMHFSSMENLPTQGA
jgi:hypothetical protein